MSGDDDKSAEADLCLPSAPRGLCFDRLDFVKSKFSVDEQVSARGEEASLERLRDDLGAYLKVLRLAMIELINRDYANFVSLSATLVGFDRAVGDIRTPLAHLKEEVLSVKQSLEDAMRELSIWRNQENMLRQKRLTLQYYSQSVASLRSLGRVVAQLEAGGGGEWSARADRAAHHHARLRFALAECRSSAAGERRERCAELGERLVRCAEEELLSRWRAADEAGVARALLTLAALDRVAETEALLRRRAVAPGLRDALTESELQRAPGGLRSLYEVALGLLDGELRPLAAAARDPRLRRRYDFVVHCFWSELESTLELQLASVFAPGDPQLFHARYTQSEEFLRQLEARCEDVRALRTSTASARFHKRWNLPVYFQIRFQEIAGGLEACLAGAGAEAAAEAGGVWSQAAAAACWRAVDACWAEGVFVRALAHKFWKLTLQLLSRYAMWLHTLADRKSSGGDPEEIDVEWVVVRARACADAQRAAALVAAVAGEAVRVAGAGEGAVRRSAAEAARRVEAAGRAVAAGAAREAAARGAARLRRVADVPRLYRKTNRGVPSAAGGYVAALEEELRVLRLRCAELLDEPTLADLVRDIFDIMTDSYYASVEDVLTSVQKTEESLRRLKQIRGGGGSGDAVAAAAEAVAGGGGAVLSDGDKIRLQVCADVSAYRGAAERAGAGAAGGRLDALQQLVARAAAHIHTSAHAH